MGKGGKSGKGGKNNAKALRNYEKENRIGLKARESEERKKILRAKIELKRLTNIYQKEYDIISGKTLRYAQEKFVENPLYKLKGAAAVAQQYYQDPRKAEYKEKKPVNYLKKYKKRLSETSNGRKYLKALLMYGLGLYNYSANKEEGINQLKLIHKYDEKDTVNSLEYLLRIFLDDSDGVEIRKYLNIYFKINQNKKKKLFFNMTAAFLEYISLLLEEKDSSKDKVFNLLSRVHYYNPYILTLFVYPSFFNDNYQNYFVLLEDEIIKKKLVQVGSLEEAIHYFYTDYSLWEETEGALDIIKEFVEEYDITPDLIAVDEQDEKDNENFSYESTIKNFNDSTFHQKFLKSSIEMEEENEKEEKEEEMNEEEYEDNGNDNDDEDNEEENDNTDYITYDEKKESLCEDDKELTDQEKKKIFGNINLEELEEFSLSIHNFLINIYNQSIDQIEEFIVNGGK